MLSAQQDPRTIRNEAIESIKTGKELYENSETPKDKAKGYKIYIKGLELMIKYTKVETNQAVVNKVKNLLKTLISRAKIMRKAIRARCKSSSPKEKEPASKKCKKGSRSHSPLTTRGSKHQEEKAIKDLNIDPHIEAHISQIIRERPNIRWDDVAGLEKAKEALREAVILPMKFPQLFKKYIGSRKGVLLYGAPGSGKTYLAKACAAETEATLFFVSSSDIISKYVGDSEKILKGIFAMAKAKKPAIIFFDEIDSVFSGRTYDQPECLRRVKTRFLVEMQEIEKDNAEVLVLAETNTPWNLDSAVRRRFEKRIYLPLPDFIARQSIFIKNLNDTPNALTPEDIQYIAAKTEGYSGSDMVVLVRDLCYEPLRQAQRATHFKAVGTLEDGKRIYQPCEPTDPGAKAMSLFDLEAAQLVLRKLNLTDCEIALERVRPSVYIKDLEMLEKFTEDFGAEG